MLKLVSLLVFCAILVFTDGIDCPLHDVFLSQPGNSMIYTRDRNYTLIATRVACPENTIFSATELKCVKLLDLNVKCTRSGRIMDTSSSNCTTYLICSQLDNGSYETNQVKCPGGMVFSPNVSRCVSTNDYICPETHENLVSGGCQGNGRFPDPNSTNCSTYLRCTQLEDGSYSSQQVACSTGTLYSSIENRCVSNSSYICPRNHNETHESLHSNGCRGNGRFPDPNSTNCSTYLRCTQLEDGSYSAQQVTCSPGTLYSSIENRCVSNSSYICPRNHNETHESLHSNGCRGNGRFPDPNSTNCSTYLRCTKLVDGSYSAQQVTCSTGTLYSSIENRCVSNSSYVCPRNHNETHESLHSNGCRGNGRFPDPNSTNCSTYLRCTQLEDGSYSAQQVTCSTGTLYSSIENRCVSNSSYVCPRNHNETHESLHSNGCRGNGRFPDPNSTNCSTYLRCTQLEDGSYSAQQVTCSTGTLYSSIENRCVSNSSYICPRNHNETHESLYSNGCRGNGRFPDPNSTNCSTYLRCTQLEDGSYSAQQVTCSTGTLYSSIENRCVSNSSYVCPRNHNETHENLHSNGCRGNGRFPDLNSTNCSTYLRCTQLEDGSYSAQQVTCSTGTLYSSIENRCVSNSSYICPRNHNETHESLHSNGCRGNGRFSDPNSTNCSTYLRCTQLEDGSYSAQQVTCSTGTLYSSIENRCVSNSSYICPRNHNETHESLHSNGCRGNGRFPDPNSTNCSTYLRCTQLEDGSYSAQQVTCSTGTLYSSIENRCVSNSSYICPRNHNETHESLHSNGCRGNGRFPDPNSTNCSTYLRCTQLEDGSYSSQHVACSTETLYSSIENRCVSNSSYVCPLHNNGTNKNSSLNGGCEGNGRFLDPNSANCSSYLICTQLNDGTYAASHVTCPPGTVFSSNLKRCVSFADYTCRPCSTKGLFPDPHSTDCSTYVSCSEDLVAQILKCPKYTLFSIEKHDCIIACDVTCHASQ